jgi:hypothetical protein
VIVCTPALGAVIVRDAMPVPESVTGLPMGDPSTENCTVPPGTGPPPVIVAWNVTEEPACGTNGVFASAVALERLLTVCTTLSELDL